MKIYKVGVYVWVKDKKVDLVLGYLRDYNSTDPHCNVIEVQATNGREAKRFAEATIKKRIKDNKPVAYKYDYTWRDSSTDKPETYIPLTMCTKKGPLKGVCTESNAEGEFSEFESLSGASGRIRFWSYETGRLKRK